MSTNDDQTIQYMGTNISIGPVEATREELIAKLSTPSVGGAIKKKIPLIKAVMDAAKAKDNNKFKENLEKVNGDLYNTLNSKLPHNNNHLNKHMKATDYGTCLYELDIIYGTYKHAFATTRHDPVVVVLEPIHELVLIAKQQIQLNHEDNIKNHLVRLSGNDLERGYLEDGGMLPEDEEHHTCLLCNHDMVDQPPSNATNRELNLQELKKLQAIIKAVREGNRIKKPYIHNGKPISRAPPAKKPLPVIYQCHCHQMMCYGPKGTNSTSCQLCLSPDSDHTIDRNGKCSCEVCKCKCMAACTVRPFVSVIVLYCTVYDII